MKTFIFARHGKDYARMLYCEQLGAQGRKSVRNLDLNHTHYTHTHTDTHCDRLALSMPTLFVCISRGCDARYVATSLTAAYPLCSASFALSAEPADHCSFFSLRGIFAKDIIDTFDSPGSTRNFALSDQSRRASQGHVLAQYFDQWQLS